LKNGAPDVYRRDAENAEEAQRVKKEFTSLALKSKLGRTLISIYYSSLNI